jgi:hypothetical protein
LNWNNGYYIHIYMVSQNLVFYDIVDLLQTLYVIIL